MPKFRQSLRYTHERLYRTISGVIVGDGSFCERLASAQRMMCVLTPSDFPPEARYAFGDIVDTPALTMSEDASCQAVRALLKLFLALSEHVVNNAALGNQYDGAAWCVLEAQEGRPAPLQRLLNTYRKRRQPLPTSVIAFRAQQTKGLVKARRGAGSRHPAQVIAIARMVKDRLEFQKLDNPKASLNGAAKHVAELIGIGFQTPKHAYTKVYVPLSSK